MCTVYPGRASQLTASLSLILRCLGFFWGGGFRFGGVFLGGEVTGFIDYFFFAFIESSMKKSLMTSHFKYHRANCCELGVKI